jgi:photosystem II stability/assembly factor-like uncharacterized protein
MRFSGRSALTGLVLSVLVFAPVAAAPRPMPPALFHGLRWRFLGPYRGGRVLAVTGVVGHPNLYYFGSVDGGVFRSRDGGVTWTPLFQHGPVASIGAIAVAPSNPRILYIGTGEADMRSDVSLGGGVFRSNNGGRTWHYVGLRRTRQISGIFVSPHNPDHVVVAALGHAFGPNSERGIYMTLNGGRRWFHVLRLGSRTGVADLVADPTNPRVLYATSWSAVRPPWTQYPPLEGYRTAIYRSTDGGRTWHRLASQGLPLAHAGRIGLAIAPHGLLYAVVSAHPGGGIYRSLDGGRTWSLVNANHDLWRRGWYFGEIFVDPKNPDIVYVPNTALYRSLDGGENFVCIKGSPSGDDFHTMWISPDRPNRMILGVDQGVAISVDGGRHWTPWLNQPTAQIYRLSTDDRYPFHIYATQQDSGSLDLVSRSDEGILTLRSWTATAGGEAGYVFADPADPHIVFGTDIGGSVSRYDSRTGQSQNISPWPLNTFGTPLPRAPYQYSWIVPLAVSHRPPYALYVGAQKVMRSTDGGRRWTTISPNLTGRTRHGPASWRTRPTVANATALGYGAIYTIAVSPLEPGDLWAGTTNGFVWHTTDGGRHWTNVTPQGLRPWSRIDRVTASPFDARSAYLAVDRHRRNDDRPYVYVTHDGGRTWSLRVHGLPSHAYVHVVREDPDRRGLLFAGTELGIYVSFDDGRIWQRLNDNLPTTAVHDIAIHGDDLLVGTHGRGIWMLHDIVPLLQAKPSIAKRRVWLFRPAVATHVRRTMFRAEPFPPEVPQAPNPQNGALLYYYLSRPVRGAITLEILGPHGRVLRTFSSTTRHRPRPLAEPAFPAFFRAPVNRLTDRAGLNRFVWHLHVARPQALMYGWGGPGDIGRTPVSPQGPFVPPGRYTVVLIAGGKRLAVPLVVREDPRVHVSTAALDAQYAFARTIAAKIDADTRLVRASEHLRPHLEKLTRSAATRAPARRLLARLTSWSGQHPARFNGVFAALLGAVESSDHVPTAAERNAFRIENTKFVALSQEYERIAHETARLEHAR